MLIGALSTAFIYVNAYNLDKIGTFDEIPIEEEQETSTIYFAKINQLKNRSQNALAYANSQIEQYPEEKGLQEAKAFIEDEIKFIELAEEKMTEEENNKLWSYKGLNYKNENAVEIIAGLEQEAEKSFYDISKTDLSVDYFYGFIGLSDERKAIVETALAEEGKIHYQWGNKPVDETIESAETYGLDCSGFIQWVYWHVLGEQNPDIMSTYSMAHTLEEISYEELKPGDIATIFNDGSFYTDDNYTVFYNEAEAHEKGVGNIVTHTNHAAIYVGKNENGLDVFVHCRGGEYDTVVVTTEEEFSSFSTYYRVLEDE